MKKRIFSMLLAVILVVGLFPTAAFAAGTTDTWAMELNVSENNLFQYNGQNVLELAYGAQSENRNLKTAQHSTFAVDLTVFDFVYNESGTATSMMDYISTSLSSDQGSYAIYSKYKTGSGPAAISWNATCKFAISQDGQTGYVILQPNSTKSTGCTSEINLASILVGFKNGKSTTDLTKTSIRFMTADEAYSFAQSSVVSLTDGATKPQNYLPDNSTEPLLGVTPRVDWGTIAIPLPQLTGSVTISGTAKFGEALTATHSNLSEGATAAYQWYRGGTPIDGAIETTYTIVEADIGKALTVKVSDSSGAYGGTVDAKPTAVVAKLDYTGVAATQAAVTPTANSVTVTNVTPGQEYAITTGSTEPSTGWQANGTFAGLTANTAYTVYTRVKATATTNASSSVTTSVTTSKLAQTITALDQSVMVEGTLNLVSSSNAAGATLVYSQGSTPPTGTTLSGSKVTAGATPGSFTVNINSAAVGNYAAAAEKTITVTVSAKTAQVFNAGFDIAAAKTYGDATFTTAATLTTGDGAITYDSSVPAVASVDPTTGAVTILKNGTTVITATAAETDGFAKATVSYTLTVAPKPLTFDTTDLSATNRSYNGLDTVALTGTLKLGGIVTGDDTNAIGITTSAGASLTGTMANANAADGKAVTISGYGDLTGSKATYYTLPSAAPTKAVNIAKADIATWTTGNMGAITATKVYDSTGTNANVTFAGEKTISGQKGETFILTPKAAQKVTYKGAGPFNAADNGYSFDITWSNFALTGTATMSNYNVPSPLTYAASGTITKATQATLTLTGVGPTATYGDEKMTLGTTGGNGTGAVTYAITANAAGAAELTDGNTKIQIKKPGSFTVKATKASDGNYNAATSATVTCTVSKKQLTWTSGTVSATKEYDGTKNDAILSGAPVLAGMAGSETVVATVKDGQKVPFNDNANVGTAHTYDVTSDMFTYTYGAGAAETNYILPANTLTPTNGKITASPITAVGNIMGTVKVGETLAIGAVAAQNGKTPVLTTDYTIQWFRADSNSANEAPIGTAVNASYTLTPDDIGKIIYAKVTGVTNYSGVVTTLKTVAVPKPAVTAIAAISGTAKFGQELTAGVLTPGTATVTYQWYRSDTDDNSSGTPIGEATLTTYTLAAADVGKYIYVQVTGKDNYSGTVSSTQTAQIAKADAPSAPDSVGKVDVAANDDTTGKLTGVSALMEYATENTFASPTAITETTVTGLPAGTYYVRIKETATTLAGAASGGLVIAPTVPNKVTGVAASGNGQLVITWAKPKMNGGTFAKYVVDIKTGGASGTSVATYPKDITVGVDTLTETVTGLTNGTAYTITVQAVNNVGAGAVSNSINATPSGGGGGGSVGGGGGVTPSESIELKQPKTDPVTGNTNVEIVVKPETKGDTSTAVIPDKVMTDAISSVVKEAAKTGGTSSVEIVIDAPKDAKTVEAELTRTIIRAVAESEVDSLKITSPVAIITFDTQALATIAAEAVEEKVIISAVIVPEKKLDAAQKALVGDAPVYELKVMSGNKIISDFKGGTATITIPYELKAGEKAEFVTVWYLDDAGKLIPIQGKYEGGFVTFTVGHFSRYAIGYLPFTDVKADWAYESIVYAYQNKLLSGVGSEKFAPADNMTRAMLWTVLYRAAGSPAKTDNANWYADAQAWAMAEKISDGTNPTGNVTRQELATILYRHAKSTAVQADMSGFSDMAEVAEWAADGMNWAVANGILKGIGDKLNPAGNATRAQVATMLQRYLTK